MSLPLVLGGLILDPLFFSIHINDLPLSIQNSEIDMYTDDTTIWSSGNICKLLQESVSNSNCWSPLLG